MQCADNQVKEEGQVELENCPFCGFHFPKDLIDNLYPSGTVWKHLDLGDGVVSRSYHSRRDTDDYDGQCWKVVCQIHMGGCSAETSGDSKEEAIAAWNRRVR